MTAIKIEPNFEDAVLEQDKILDSPETFINHIGELVAQKEPILYQSILEELQSQFQVLDFKVLAYPAAEKLIAELAELDPTSDQAKAIKKELAKLRLNNKHFLVLSIENILAVADTNNWGLCKNKDFIYLYNGAYWANIEKETFQKFLGEAAEKMGVPRFSARYYQFREHLFKQFLSTAYLPTPIQSRDVVYINLMNGTFEITPQGTQLRPFDRDNFITYQLPFNFYPEANAPMFQSYLDRVIPDTQRQLVLAEYLGYVFIKHGSNSLKEEKALILYGTGANGKSVFFEIVNALLGDENVGHYSLQSLTNENGYYRAKIANKLVNYASEINNNLEAAIFKQLVSGEPVEARLPYGSPFTLEQYAKLIFNCNELPKDVEHTNAYFRRFLIIPFDTTIPEAEQDKELASKIINKEMSGIFNWVLSGLNRLLSQKRFTYCEAVHNAREQYEKQSDSTKMFLDDRGYEASPTRHESLKELYQDYRTFCLEDGFKPVNKTNFIKRIKAAGFVIEKRNVGNVVFVTTNIQTF